MKKFLVSGLILLITLILSINVFAASPRYSFDMRFKIVDGKKNGEFHTLDSGKAKISGLHYIYYSEYPESTKLDVNYTLQESRFGFDREIGTVRAKAEGSVSGTFGSVSGGDKYYLQVWIRDTDYHYRRGSGKIYN